MNILGIETSCDETGVAVVHNGTRILSNIIASQDHLHASFGGVVPEIAARCHSERMEPLVAEALACANVTADMIEGVAVTQGPGLMGALLVGISYAKAWAYAKKVPFCGVNHLEAHLHAIFLEHQISYPFIGLLVSGGHTALFDVRGVHDLVVLGTTQDDAAGEAFDKVAKLLGLGYPGGKRIDDLSKRGNRFAVDFPKPTLKNHPESHLHFSFSGLKTAIYHFLKKNELKVPVEDIAASFQETVTQILVKQSVKALRKTGYNQCVVAGGVAANSRLREIFQETAQQEHFNVYFPSLKLCTDNAAMVASLGYHDLKMARYAALNLDAYAHYI